MTSLKSSLSKVRSSDARSNAHCALLGWFLIIYVQTNAEWKDEETDVAKYLEQSGATGSGGAPSHLWEDSWDDDDVEENFSVQLRYLYASLTSRTSFLHSLREELAKSTKPDSDAMVS
jgi:DSS1/SEM1 family